MATEYTHLYYYSEDGNSDKEYIAVLEDNEDDTFNVYALYGRRGSATNRTDKVTNTSEYSARRAYDRLIHEKTAKGYRVFSAPQLNIKQKAPKVLNGHTTTLVKSEPNKRKITI